MNVKNVFFGCFIMLLPYCSFSQERVVTINEKNKVLPVQSVMEIFLDSSNTMSLKEIEARYRAGDFITPDREVPNLTGIDGTVWFRIKIINALAEPVYLSFSEIYAEEIAIYLQNEVGRWKVYHTGFLYPYESRELPGNRYSIKVDNFGKVSEHVIFGTVRAKFMPPLLIRANVGSAYATVNESRHSEFVSVSVLGILLIMLFYNFCLYIVISDRLFLYYCVYIVSSILLITWFTGFLFEWVWPNSPAWNPYPLGMAPFFFAQVWFVNHMLEVRHHLPRFYRVSYCIYFFVIALVFGMILPSGFARAISMVLGLIIPTYFLICAVRMLQRKIRIAGIFLMGWIPLLLVTIANVLMIGDALPYSIFYDKHAVEVTLAWELIIFSLVLGYRYNNMRHEKSAIQNENMRIITEQKATLRKMVFEQTEEIMAQNDQLIKNQEEIKLQNDRLETQNKAYERLKELILKQNHELETAVQRRTLQLAQSNEELKKHLHQVEQFSFISAHNLRAPVARILGLASIFDVSKVVGKENLTVLEKIVASARDLDIIIHDLGAILDTQKNTSEKTEMIDVKELLYKILSRYEAEVGKEGIHVSINAEAKQLAAVPAYIDSILSNLISNSIKYRAEDRPPYIQIATEEMPSAWRIEVEDNGLGFDSKAFSRKLFEPFQRFHTHKDGKGLGMFLVKTQVMAMEGAIELISEPNKGTKVIITLPKRRLQKSA